MHHFFVTPQQISGDKIRIEGGDVNHMKNVLRMKLHEKAEISDGESRTYLCEVEAYEEDVAILHILEEMEADTEPASKLYLFQGLPKSDKMELIVQKAVELGVYQVIPVAMKRSVVRLDDKKAAKKADRWNSIAESAAKQAGRSRIPEVTMPLSYKEALKMAEELDVTLFPYELAGGMEVTREVIRQKVDSLLGFLSDQRVDLNRKKLMQQSVWGRRSSPWASGSCGQRQPDLQRLLY